MNKSAYLGLSILELSKTVLYKFQHDYAKPKYEEKAKLCYMYTGSFIVYIKTEDIYADIANHVEALFDTSNYELERPLPKAKNEKIIGLIKDELGPTAALKGNTYSYLTEKK